MEHIKPYAQVFFLIILGGCVKVIANIKGDVDDLRNVMNEKFNTTDVKISKVQATTDAKFDTVRAQAALDATSTYLKLNHNEKYVSLRPPNPTAGVVVASPSASHDGD